jgi:hypothetical protein
MYAESTGKSFAPSPSRAQIDARRQRQLGLTSVAAPVDSGTRVRPPVAFADVDLLASVVGPHNQVGKEPRAPRASIALKVGAQVNFEEAYHELTHIKPLPTSICAWNMGPVKDHMSGGTMGMISDYIAEHDVDMFVLQNVGIVVSPTCPTSASPPIYAMVFSVIVQRFPGFRLYNSFTSNPNHDGTIVGVREDRECPSISYHLDVPILWRTLAHITRGVP